MTSETDVRPPVVFIIGPTATGKTAAAMALAETRPVQVINADSRQVYKGMSIGTAKPTPEEQVAVPHHLIDVVEPSEGYSLATFLSQARTAITKVLAEGGVPVVVGGTGQYVWGLADGWLVPEVPPDPELRQRLEQEATEIGPLALHAKLAAVDPGAAAGIEAQNVRRVIRALEVWEITGELSDARPRQQSPPFRPLMVGITVARPKLYRRIDFRVDAMIGAGWVEEVRKLVDGGFTPDLPAFSSAGYREIAAHLRGELSLPQALPKVKMATHRLARKQGSWFRASNERIVWCKNAKDLVRVVSDGLG